MNGNTLTNVSNPVNGQDVTTKSYVDNVGEGGDKVSKSGDTMTGELDMVGNRIIAQIFPRLWFLVIHRLLHGHI